MGKLSRTKGASFERVIANELREALHLPKEAARRGLQSRRGGAEVPDVVVDDLPLHIECKHSGSATPPAALRQASHDCLTRESPHLPVVILKRDRLPAVVHMYGLDYRVFQLAVTLGMSVTDALKLEVDAPYSLAAHRIDGALTVSLPWAVFLAALASLPPLPSAIPTPPPVV